MSKIICTTVPTTKEIRNLNAQGKISMTSGCYSSVIFDDGTEFVVNGDCRLQTKIYNKLLKMGYQRHYNFSSDECDGLCEAARIGENPFKFTMICSNTDLNGSY